MLEGIQSSEEDKREDIFFNETLAQDEITQLFEPKVLTNAKRYTAKGEKPLDKFTRDAELNRKRGLPEDTITDNLIIKGNNLLALHSLKEEFAGKVKLIYIDPPYNTGKDGFNYNDNFNHSSWLTFMKNRLEVSRELLMKEGSIWINIDDREAHYLKVLGDDIFGRDNFIINVVWQKKYAPQNDAKFFTDNHDHILVIAKSKTYWKLNPLKRTEENNKQYINDDNDGKGIWRTDNILVKSFTKDRVFPIVNPNTKKEYFPPKGRCWRYAQNTLEKMITENRIYFGKNGKGAPQVKRYLNEVKEGITPLSIWLRTDVGDNQQAKNEIYDFENVITFSTPKPERLIQRIINIGSSENDIILDFFAGSGTSAAVAHKMNRQYIGIEQMDYIEDVTIERMKKVMKGEQGGISESVNWRGGGEFVYFELQKFNEAFIEKIETAKDTKSLLKIWEEMKQRSFLNYNVDIKKQEESIEEFKKLSLKQQKKLLAELLDKNQLYVNLSSMDDKDFKVTEEEKKVTRDFYKIRK
ncbi:MAG TPA: site-specific DNA-methyltransferase [Saprospirales bacterium]|nr:site-specific DNA-methyltransferase [Saprospirales bacterium]